MSSVRWTLHLAIMARFSHDPESFVRLSDIEDGTFMHVDELLMFRVKNGILDEIREVCDDLHPGRSVMRRMV